MEKPNVCVVDADGTIFGGEALYDEAYLEFFLYLNKMFRNFFPCLHTIYRGFFERHEKINAKNLGVKKERILYSMLDLYEEACSYVDAEFNINFRRAEHIEHIRTIAKIPFDIKKFEWLPGAEEVLRHLISKGHRLCLLSSYDEGVFSDKKAHLGINRFFQEGNILTTEFGKTTQDFIRVSGWSPETENDFAKWYTIGNGKSDILPALEISPKWEGLYVRRATTSPYLENSTNEFIPPILDHPRVINLTNIKQILPYI